MTRVLGILVALALSCASTVVVLPSARARELVPVPAGHEADLLYFGADGARRGVSKRSMFIAHAGDRALAFVWPGDGFLLSRK
jgi:hypothetical protein